MKVIITLLIHWFAITTLIAQDSTGVICYTKKTFVIRKKNKDKPSTKKEVLVAPSQKKIKTNNITINVVEDHSKKHPTTTSPLSEKEIPAKLPTLISGEFGLMDIQVYKENMDLKNWKFVALEYSINTYGWVYRVKVLKTNDPRLEKLVLKKLGQSKWNPALNKKGQAIAYKMYQQVVIVKDRTYEEDYINDY